MLVAGELMGELHVSCTNLAIIMLVKEQGLMEAIGKGVQPDNFDHI